MAKAEILIPFVKSWEGGYVNHPNDKGGPTNRGITLKTFRSFYGFGKSITDLKNMTDAQWFSIFKRGYWDKCKADQIIDQSVANLMVDWCWGSGTTAIKMVQGVVGVKADGIVGPLTLCAINKEDGASLFIQLWNQRSMHFRACASKPGQGVFLNGWLNRLNGIRYGKLCCNSYRRINGVRERKCVIWDDKYSEVWEEL